MNRILATIGLLILFLVGKSFSAHLCKCYEPDSVKKAYIYTDFIIHGKVIAKKKVPVLETINLSKSNEILEKYKFNCRQIQPLEWASVIQVDMEVLRLYKGLTKKDVVKIFTYSSSASCGFTWFEVGKEYLVYANQRNDWFTDDISDADILADTYWTHQCTRTNSYDKFEGQELEEIELNIKKD